MWQSILLTTKPPNRKNNYASQSRYLRKARRDITNRWRNKRGFLAAIRTGCTKRARREWRRRGGPAGAGCEPAISVCGTAGARPHSRNSGDRPNLRFPQRIPSTWYFASRQWLVSRLVVCKYRLWFKFSFLFILSSWINNISYRVRSGSKTTGRCGNRNKGYHKTLH